MSAIKNIFEALRFLIQERKGRPLNLDSFIKLRAVLTSKEIDDAEAELASLLRERDEWKARVIELEKELEDTKGMLREPWD